MANLSLYSTNSKKHQKKVVIREYDTPLQALRERISKSKAKEVQQLKLDDSFLLKYLRARDFDIELAYQLIKGYFLIRRTNPDMFRVASEGKCT